MKILVTFAISMLLSFEAHAYKSETPEWDSVEIQTVIDGDRVIVTATASKDRLTSLVVTMKGKRTVVAPAEFSDLVRPRLNTLRVISPDSKSSPGPTVMVELNVESDADLNGLPPGNVRFHFGQFKYFGRDVSYHQLVHEIKAPGQPPKQEKTNGLMERRP